MAKPGSALVTGDTLKLAEGYVQVRPLGAVPVKGLETPTPVYELTGIVPARSRLQASAARGLTRFVGRDAELEQLGAGARARRRGPRAGGRRRGRGRRGEVAARLGVHAVPPHPRLAGARERLGLLREGHAVPARHRPAEGVLPDPGARRPAGDPRARGRQAPDAGPRAGAAPDAAAGAAGRPRRRCRVGRPRPAPAPAADPGGGQAAAPPGEPGPAAARWSSRISTGSTPRPRRCSTA